MASSGGRAALLLNAYFLMSHLSSHLSYTSCEMMKLEAAPTPRAAVIQYGRLGTSGTALHIKINAYYYPHYYY